MAHVTHYHDAHFTLTYYSRLKIDKYCTRNVFSCSSFAEESIEGIITTSNGLVTGHLAIRLNAVLKAVQLPACVSNLDTSLAGMYRDTLALKNEIPV